MVIPSLNITNTAWRLIEWIHDLFVGYVSALEQKKHWKTAYRWVLEGLDAVKLIKKCARWFIVKAQHVKLYVKYRLPQKTPSDYVWNWRISERIQKLNRRGR